jgi:hypothetical protein
MTHEDVILFTDGNLYVRLDTLRARITFTTNSDRYVVHITHDDVKRLVQLKDAEYIGAKDD